MTSTFWSSTPSAVPCCTRSCASTPPHPFPKSEALKNRQFALHGPLLLSFKPHHLQTPFQNLRHWEIVDFSRRFVAALDHVCQTLLLDTLCKNLRYCEIDVLDGMKLETSSHCSRTGGAGNSSMCSAVLRCTRLCDANLTTSTPSCTFIKHWHVQDLFADALSEAALHLGCALGRKASACAAGRYMRDTRRVSALQDSAPISNSSVILPTAMISSATGTRRTPSRMLS